jgi:hypothetical protein
MPKISVNENRDPLFFEYEVRLAREHACASPARDVVLL